ncbi:MAG: helicase [Myxococcales bacterium]|nr:helicase [Myxococcales bacterium]
MGGYLDSIFGPAGVFARALPGYEDRPGQYSLAKVIDAGFTGSNHVIGEGPTGVGKSLAYLIPAIMHAVEDDRKTVVATGNISLQEQLIRKDLPFLQRVLPHEFTFALLKGRSNYLCKRAASEVRSKGTFSFMPFDDEAGQIETIMRWCGETDTGDVSDLPFKPSHRVWGEFSTSPDDCDGRDCPFAEDCWCERAKRKAAESNITVVNFHLLFADLQVRNATDGGAAVIPDYDFLVGDEAHKMADIARDFLGVQVGPAAIDRIVRRLIKYRADNLANALNVESESFFNRVRAYRRSPDYHIRLRHPGAIALGGLSKQLSTAASFFHNLTETIDDPAERRRLQRTEAACDRVRGDLVSIIGLSDPNLVAWIEESDRGYIKLVGRPLDVSDILRHSLFERTESVVLVSATLSTNGNFDFIKGEIGLDDPLELIVESPFDFRSQALLVVPHGLPDPRDDEFPDVVARGLKRVIDDVGGRTLGLFTSYRVLDHVYAAVSGNGHRILKQGQASNTTLIEQFRNDRESVLLGTESFWQGVDAPGDTLSVVVIDKLPFPSPADPIVDAIVERNPRGWFFDFFIPKAIIALKQGFGRLIRSRTDVGVAVIFDPRIVEKPYGRKFINSLPSMYRTRDLGNVAAFLEAKR